MSWRCSTSWQGSSASAARAVDMAAGRSETLEIVVDQSNAQLDDLQSQRSRTVPARSYTDRRQGSRPRRDRPPSRMRGARRPVARLGRSVGPARRNARTRSRRPRRLPTAGTDRCRGGAPRSGYGGHGAERPPDSRQGDVQAVPRRLRGSPGQKTSIRTSRGTGSFRWVTRYARRFRVRRLEEGSTTASSTAITHPPSSRAIGGPRSSLPGRALVPVTHRSPARLQYAPAYQRVHG